MKRFTDTEIWKKPWFRKLPPSEKTALSFIKDMCDSVGVWTPDFEMAEFFVGESVDWERLKENSNGNIKILDNGKWWLVDFCTFQYGELDEESNSKPIISYIRQLKKHGLWEEYQRVCKGYDKGIHTLQEKEKEKEKEKEEEKDKPKKQKADGVHAGTGVPINKKRYETLCNDYGKEIADDQIQQAVDYSMRKKGDTTYYKEYASAAATFAKKAGIEKQGNQYKMVSSIFDEELP